MAHRGINAFVVPECADKEHISIPDGYNFYWTGQIATKGLGVFVNEECNHCIPSWYDPTLSYAIPVIIENEYLLLAVWPTLDKVNRSQMTYIDLLLEILEHYKEYIAQYKTLIIGDYNIISNPKRKQGNNQRSTQIFDWMEQNGLRSAHHSVLNEEYGCESAPTYYHLYKESQPFFIDYAFTNAYIVLYSLYSWDETERMSDHVPIEIEIK